MLQEHQDSWGSAFLSLLAKEAGEVLQSFFVEDKTMKRLEHETHGLSLSALRPDQQRNSLFVLLSRRMIPTKMTDHLLAHFFRH